MAAQHKTNISNKSLLRPRSAPAERGLITQVNHERSASFLMVRFSDAALRFRSNHVFLLKEKIITSDSHCARYMCNIMCVVLQKYAVHLTSCDVGCEDRGSYNTTFKKKREKKVILNLWGKVRKPKKERLPSCLCV